MDCEETEPGGAHHRRRPSPPRPWTDHHLERKTPRAGDRPGGDPVNFAVTCPRTVRLQRPSGATDSSAGLNNCVLEESSWGSE